MTDANPDSILDTVKHALGLSVDYTSFDLDVIMGINSAFGSLKQLGVGADTGFIISDRSTLWSQYVSDIVYLGMIQQFITMKARLGFDPPNTSFGISAIEKMIEELSVRINMEAEHINPPSDPFADSDDEDITEGGSLSGFFAPKVVQMTYASTVSIDASQGNVFYLTMTGDCTINIVNGTDGEHITLELISDSFGVTWGSGWNFGAAGEPTLSTHGRTDIISSVYRASASDWYTGFTPGF